MPEDLTKWTDGLAQRLSTDAVVDELLTSFDPKDPAHRARWMPEGFAALALLAWETRTEFGQAISQAGFTPGKRVLELGCGPGIHARCLAQLGAREVCAIDGNRHAWALAKTINGTPSQVSWVNGDYTTPLPAQDDTFDIVLAINPAQNVFSSNVLGEIGRVLTPSGCFVTADLVRHTPLLGAPDIPEHHTKALHDQGASAQAKWTYENAVEVAFSRSYPLSLPLRCALSLQFGLFKAPRARKLLGGDVCEQLMNLYRPNSPTWLFRDPNLTVNFSWNIQFGAPR